MVVEQRMLLEYRECRAKCAVILAAYGFYAAVTAVTRRDSIEFETLSDGLARLLRFAARRCVRCAAQWARGGKKYLALVLEVETVKSR